jgi:hypothetical protein
MSKWLWLSLLLLGSGQIALAEKVRTIKMGGAACVMAKFKGNTLDYVLITGKDHPLEAIEAGEAILREKGYDRYWRNVDIISTQTTSNYPFAYVIVVKADYETQWGQRRINYGCGFSPKSLSEAQWRALRDLQSHSWGWHPNLGFEVVEKLKYGSFKVEYLD